MPAIIYLNFQSQDTEDNNTNTPGFAQEEQPETCTSEPTQLDALLQNIIRSDSQLLEKPKSLTSSKRPRNKKTTTESKPARPH